MDAHEFPAVAKVHERWTVLAKLFCAASERAAPWSKASEDLLLGGLTGHACRDVLDLACGVGDPALRLASEFPEARIVALDFVEEMTREVERRANAAKLTNIQTRVSDMLNLPFADGSFDTVTSRFGFQYYDREIKRRALGEAARVLAPGGKMVIVDWGVEGHGPLKSFYMDVLSQYRETAHANDAATAFSLQDDASFAALVREVGFESVKHGYPEVHWQWSGSPSSLWEIVMALAPQLTEIMAGLPPKLRAEIHERIVHGLGKYMQGSGIIMPVRHVLVTGVRSHA
jgi:ubiquinone/menaquinone biosynthesis C-methylase UbiE